MSEYPHNIKCIFPQKPNPHSVFSPYLIVCLVSLSELIRCPRFSLLGDLLTWHEDSTHAKLREREWVAFMVETIQINSICFYCDIHYLVGLHFALAITVLESVSTWYQLSSKFGLNVWPASGQHVNINVCFVLYLTIMFMN